MTTNKIESFEKQLFKAADKLRKNIDAAEYKHIVLGLVFLKYISDSFEELYNKLKEGEGDYKGANPEDQDEYRAQNVFWVPQNVRWSYIHSRAKLPSIGTDLDDAMELIEKENPTLKGILAKVYAKPNLDKTALGGLIDLISNTALGSEAAKSKDLLGRVYEYFLGEFANSEGKKGGQFYTPKAIVRLLVEMIEPYKGRVYDPCCGSGGMFVMSEKFVLEHSGRLDDVSIYGQESNQTTYRLSRMNMAIRGIDGSQIKWNNEGSFLKDAHPDLKADFIIANPPFNQSDWGQEILRNDPRWQYGLPPTGNANFAWMQHMIYHLAPKGVMGLVLANGSLSSNTSGEGEIRQRIVEADLVDCIVSLPKQLFYNTPIPASLWFISKKRHEMNGDRKRTGEILFIDASELGFMADRTHRDFSDEAIKRITSTYHEWRKHGGEYKDVKGFCKSVALKEVEKHNFTMTPGRYVGITNEERDGVPLEVDIKIANQFLKNQTEIESKLDKEISKNLGIIYPDYDWSNISFSSSKVLEKLIQDIFQYWFIEFNYPDADGSIFTSKLGEIPKGWQVKGIRAYVEHVKKHVKPYESPTQSFIHYSIPAFDSEMTAEIETGKQIMSNKYSVPDNCFLVSKLNPSTPRIWMILKSTQGAICSTEFQVIRPTSKEYFGFIYCAIKSSPYTRELSSRAHGTSSSHQRVTPDDILDVPLAIPNHELISHFSELIFPFLKKIDFINSQIQSLSSFRAELITNPEYEN